MFFEILIFSFLGIFVGVLTGIVPGLHPNTIFTILISVMFLFTGISPILVIVFIVSLSISNTFLDFIPSIFFGAPDTESCLSVLPGHRMLMDGRGYEALYLTAMGGFWVCVLTVMTLPLLIVAIPAIYNSIYPYLHILLVFVVLWMVFTEKGMLKIYSAAMFLLSGVFGVVVLNSGGSDAMLFPALSGLFGMSAMIVSFRQKTRLPIQKKTIPNEIHPKGTLTGWLAGMLAGLLPGIGSAQAGIIASQGLRADAKDFLCALGGINTANILFTFVMLYTLNKTRSGAAWAISQITDGIMLNDIAIMVVVALLSCFISVVLTLKAGSFIASNISRINYNKMNLIVMAVLVILVAVFSGPIGLLVLFTGTLIGLFTIHVGIKRSQLMGFLVLPTILYFSGTLSGTLFFMGL